MATKYLGPSPKLRATDQNGTPLVGGFVYAYEAGTTTPITTYSNSAGTANAWPITLDSRGECSLYLTPGIKCDLRVTDANGVLQYTQTRESAPVTPASYFAGLMVATTQSSLFTTIVAPGGTFTGNLDFEAAFNYAVPVSLTSSASTAIGAAASNTVTIAPATPGYFDSGYKGTALTLSVNNSTATVSGSLTYGTVLGVTGRSSGKGYFEVQITVNLLTGNSLFGVANRSVALNSYLGIDANGWTACYNTGVGNPIRNYHSNVTSALNVASVGAPYVIGIALDMDAGEIRSYINNTLIKTDGSAIYSGLTGTLYPAISLYNTNDQVVLRILSSEFSYSPPSGYSAWDS
jgi:hypothetical protein